MLKINCRKITMGLLFAALLCMSGCTAEKEVQDLYGVELEAPEAADASEEQNQQVNYKTITAEPGEFVRRALANVSLRFPVTAEITCEKEKATIQEIFVRTGDQVKQGDPLISFELEVSNVAIEECSLKLQRCREAMEKGKTEREKTILEAEAEAEALWGREQEIARLKIEKLKTEYDEFVYASEYEEAKYTEQLEALEQEKEVYTITAPFDGEVDFLERVKPGDRAEPGQLLLTLYDPEQYYLAAEDIAGNLRYNAEVVITAGPKSETKTYVGKVVSAYNVLGPAVPTGDPLICLEEEVPAEELEVAPKYEADIERLQNVLLLKKSVVRMDEDRNYVRILNGDMIQKRYIVPALRNSEFVWVLYGLSEEQQIIAE